MKDSLHNHEASLEDVFYREVTRLERQIKIAEANVLRWGGYSRETSEVYKHQLHRLKIKQSLLRMPSVEDFVYRKRLLAEFPDLISGLDLGSVRFHGAPIVSVKEIIESGEISSAIEHDGIRRSNDISGQISISQKDSVIISIRDYINRTEYAVPLGCVFVIKWGVGTWNIPNVNIRSTVSTEPTLVRVLASPESLLLVRKWLEENQIDINIASEFFELN